MSTHTTTDALAIVRGFYDALSTGDLSLVDASLAPDWEAVPALRTVPGAEGWKASVSHLRGVFTDLDVVIEDVLVDGDRVAVRTLTSGVHSGELLGVEGTGKRIEFRATDVHRLRDGRVVQTWHLEDYFGIALQLGLAFVPAA
ncbi:MAG TPA: ester cyclase [Luteimicrobium sp.]|nr:ester cyclase [Luteimicrobium sp.]